MPTMNYCLKMLNFPTLPQDFFHSTKATTSINTFECKNQPKFKVQEVGCNLAQGEYGGPCVCYTLHVHVHHDELEWPPRSHWEPID